MTDNADNRPDNADNPVAVLLERAARELRAVAGAATEGPWRCDDSPECWRLHGTGVRVPPQTASDGTVLIGEQVLSRQILKAPKHGTPYAEYWPDEDDARWITRMHPGVGLALAGWLEHEAREARALLTTAPADCGHGPFGGPCECEPVTGWDCGACLEPLRPGRCGCWDGALAVARTWLGETTETGEGIGD